MHSAVFIKPGCPQMPSIQSASENPSAVAGCLVGQAIGDMMGLPYENLSPRRVAKLVSLDRPRIFFGYGCGSDDTEHMGLTAEAIAFAQGDVSKFRYLSRQAYDAGSLPGRPGSALPRRSPASSCASALAQLTPACSLPGMVRRCGQQFSECLFPRNNCKRMSKPQHESLILTRERFRAV